MMILPLYTCRIVIIYSFTKCSPNLLTFNILKVIYTPININNNNNNTRNTNSMAAGTSTVTYPQFHQNEYIIKQPPVSRLKIIILIIIMTF